MNCHKGFTLIEVIIYVGLFALIMSGVVVSMYTLFESTARSATRAQLQEEGNYLVQKIDWYLSQTKTVQLPIQSGGVLSLMLTDNSLVTIDTRSGNLRIQTNSDSPVILNNSNVSVDTLSFTHDSVNGTAQNVSVHLSLTEKTSDGHTLSQTFTETRYLLVYQ